MALLDDLVNGGNLATGLMVGAGMLIARPLIGPIARPLANTLIKGGLIASRQAEQLYAGAVEGIGDIIAEAQQEVGAPPKRTLPKGAVRRPREKGCANGMVTHPTADANA